MVHLGDIKKIKRAPFVDCITFGSPCQDLSIAGNRAGLAGDRSGLFMDAVRIIREMEEQSGGLYPTFAVWENVHGAFSSNKGEDFRAVVEELAKVKEPGISIPRPENGKWAKAGFICGDGWSIAWRTLDAQFWGVPQRRRRIALVMDFRGQRAGEVLFERTGMSGDFEPSITPWQGVARNPAHSVAGYDRVVEGAEVGTLKIRSGCDGGEKGPLAIVFESHSQDARYAQQGDTPPACTAQWGAGGNNMPLVAFSKETYNMGKNARCSLGIESGDIAPTIRADTCPGGVAYQEAITLRNDTVANTLLARDYKGVGRADSLGKAVAVKTLLCWIVRRLTPTECERLQGFPDGWTDIGDWTDSKGKRRKAADSPRYKALGNSIALPQWWWLTCKMARHLPERATLGSLFDGIGGFPLVWETYHGKGTSAWASEIEPFCIAVTKKHFGGNEI